MIPQLAGELRHPAAPVPASAARAPGLPQAPGHDRPSWRVSTGTPAILPIGYQGCHRPPAMIAPLMGQLRHPTTPPPATAVRKPGPPQAPGHDRPADGPAQGPHPHRPPATADREPGPPQASCHDPPVGGQAPAPCLTEVPAIPRSPVPADRVPGHRGPPAIIAPTGGPAPGPHPHPPPATADQEPGHRRPPAGIPPTGRPAPAP
jgi:hypothetical protein